MPLHDPSPRRRAAAVVTLCLVQFVDVLGVTVVVAALPGMLADHGHRPVEESGNHGRSSCDAARKLVHIVRSVRSSLHDRPWEVRWIPH